MSRHTTSFSLASLLLLLLPSLLSAAGPPRVSPQSTVSQVVGVSQISISYSRPAAREGVIWGELVPPGEVWRTGANEETIITFPDDVRVEGRNLAAGTYGLFIIPGEREWIVAFNTDAEQHGVFSYNPARDVLRIPIKPREAPRQDTFLITFPDVGIDTALVSLRWGSLEIAFAVKIDLEKIAPVRAREFVGSAGAADGRAVWEWANYFYQSGYNAGEALGWAARLAETTPMYWTHALHARLLARTGDIPGAIEEASRALVRAGSESHQPGVEADAQNLKRERAVWQANAG